LPPQGAGGTQISGHIASGDPIHSPHIDVYAAADADAASIPWWAALFIALIAFGAGMFCGYLLATS
jgi:hypothetical protein